MAENAQNNALNTHLPPKTPIGQIRANTEHSQQIIGSLVAELIRADPTAIQENKRYIALTAAQTALKDFEIYQLHELRIAFE